MRQSGLQNFSFLASVFICISSFHYLDPWLVPLAVNKEIIICCLPANCVCVCALVQVSVCVCVCVQTSSTSLYRLQIAVKRCSRKVLAAITATLRFDKQDCGANVKKNPFRLCFFIDSYSLHLFIYLDVTRIDFLSLFLTGQFFQMLSRNFRRKKHGSSMKSYVRINTVCSVYTNSFYASQIFACSLENCFPFSLNTFVVRWNTLQRTFDSQRLKKKQFALDFVLWLHQGFPKK